MEKLVVSEFNTPQPEFWKDKRVLLTGLTGFKGAWMALWLTRLGAQVTGVSLAPETNPNLFELAGIGMITESQLCDIRDSTKLEELIKKAKPDLVFHLAAQALVLPSYRDPLNTFSTNVQGTANLLNAIRHIDTVQAVVAITSDKVYRNFEDSYPYRETDELGGQDPYSASKAAAEIVIASFRESYFRSKGIALASARAGNVIGGGDWSEDRLIPDAVRAWSKNKPLFIRRPKAIRPWQHVLEPVSCYLRLAEMLCLKPNLAGAYNFGPQSQDVATVQEVVVLAKSAYGRGQVEWGNGTDGPHEAGWLSLEISKAKKVLGLKPRWALIESVQRTMNWYRQFGEGSNALNLCHSDIDAYEAEIKANVKYYSIYD